MVEDDEIADLRAVKQLHTQDDCNLRYSLDNGGSIAANEVLLTEKG